LEMAGKAQDIDPSNGLSYSAQAFAFLANQDFEKALSASEKAIQLAPNDPYVMSYHGFTLCAYGDPESGIAFAETALRLDPLNERTPYLNILGVIRFQAGHYEDALKSFLRNQERDGPTGAGVHFFLAAAHFALGDSTTAAAMLNVADLTKNENYDWEGWVRRSWRQKEDSDHILNLIKHIRESEA
jgi:adenylate cyclase